MDIKGIVGEKVGMTQIFVETRAVPVTVIKAGPCVVTQIRTQAADGYDAVQLAYGSMRPQDVIKPAKGHFDKVGVEPMRHLVELRTPDAGSYETGQEVTADLFAVGDKVDVVGVSKGKGFSGVMKRHGFAGLGGGHGVHKKHRSPGAIGACATPSRVFKGMRMAGHAGQPAHDRAEPRGGPGRPRARTAADQGRRARPQRRARDGAHRREDPAEGTDGEGSVSMASIDTMDAAGTKTGSRDLPADLFEAPVNVPLMHQVVVASMAGLRAGTHKVKTRGEVRGGGKKPWRQKGTGRARQGSIRSPQWVGGGVAHGPVVRDHNQRINKKMVKGALRSALTDALASGKLIVVDDLGLEEPKTRQAADALTALGCDGRVLLVLAQPSEASVIEKSVRNLQMVKVVYARGIGTYDVLLADHVVFTGEALDALAGGEAA